MSMYPLPPRLAPSSSSSSSSSAQSKRQRPRGLWRARANPPRYPAGKTLPELYSGAYPIHIDRVDTDDEIDDSASTYSRKRRRFSSSEIGSSADDEPYWDPSRPCSPGLSVNISRVDKVMDSSTTAGPGTQSDRVTCDFEDWEDLKELFAKAAEQYESDDASEALPLLRGVIHECHRFILFYEDPSVLFSNPHPSNDTKSRQSRDYAQNCNHNSRATQGASKSTSTYYTTQLQQQRDRACKCVELPTAFHAILGTALFLFGNLIAHQPGLSLSGEPSNPTPYWLAALDVFETGENLPSRTSGRGCAYPEDWRMAIVWGRTLICLADEIVTRAQKHKQAMEANGGTLPDSAFTTAQFDDDEPNWPLESPFSAIAARRPPVTRRMSLSTASTKDLMMLAMDQFSRGIFHMPHPKPLTPTPSGAASSSSSLLGGVPTPVPSPPVAPEPTFSRPKELYTLASEVLLLSEKLDSADQRAYWAAWADSVFGQIRLGPETESWIKPVTLSRGRSWLIAGTTRAEEFEEALEKGETDMLNSEEAQDARDALVKAVDFLGKAVEMATEQEVKDVQPLLVEALLTLANLTVDEVKREELYARAQAEGGSDLDIAVDEDDDDGMDEDE